MISRVGRQTAGTRFLGLVFLAMPPLPIPVIDSSVAYAAEQADLFEINTAKADQLDVLPGIGEAYSEKIVKIRPYAQKDELVQNKIHPRATYEQIKYKIVGKQK